MSGTGPFSKSHSSFRSAPQLFIAMSVYQMVVFFGKMGAFQNLGDPESFCDRKRPNWQSRSTPGDALIANLEENPEKTRRIMTNLYMLSTSHGQNFYGKFIFSLECLAWCGVAMLSPGASDECLGFGGDELWCKKCWKIMVEFCLSNYTLF